MHQPALGVQQFPPGLRTEKIPTNGTALHVRIGGEKSFGPTMATVMRAAATDVTELVIPNCGHWLMEEQPATTIAAVRAFLGRNR
jgi:pimeloyl-ACP methyl ester carboxylesterase